MDVGAHAAAVAADGPATANADVVFGVVQAAGFGAATATATFDNNTGGVVHIGVDAKATATVAGTAGAVERLRGRCLVGGVGQTSQPITATPS